MKIFKLTRYVWHPSGFGILLKEKGGVKHVAKHTSIYRDPTTNCFPDNANWRKQQVLTPFFGLILYRIQRVVKHILALPLLRAGTANPKLKYNSFYFFKLKSSNYLYHKLPQSRLYKLLLAIIKRLWYTKYGHQPPKREVTANARGQRRTWTF